MMAGVFGAATRRKQMKRLLLILLTLCFIPIASAAPPSRSFTYTDKNIIEPDENNANENALYNYLQAGVDTYVDGSIANADINQSANIDKTKIAGEACTLSDDQTFTGIKDFTTEIKINGSAGTSGQFLRSSGSGADAVWASAKVDGSVSVIGASDSVDTTRADSVCDGASDDVEIQAAITAATAGGRVILLEGTYNISATITLVNDVTLEGSGWGTVLEADINLNNEIITATTLTDVTVKNLKLDNRTNAQSDSESCLELAEVNDAVVENVFFYGEYDNVTQPVLYINNCDRVFIRGNTFDCEGGAATGGIIVFDTASTYCVVANNVIDGTDISTGNGTACISSNAASAGVTFSAFTGNVLIGDNVECDYGIRLGSTDCDSNTIVGNMIYNMHVDGIIIVANADQNVVVGNVMRDGISDSGTGTVDSGNNKT